MAYRLEKREGIREEPEREQKKKGVENQANCGARRTDRRFRVCDGAVPTYVRHYWQASEASLETCPAGLATEKPLVFLRSHSV